MGDYYPDSPDAHEIQQLVERARAGDPESMEALIDLFQPLIQSYLRLALQGTVNYRDPIMLGFVRAYGSTAVDGAVTLRDRLSRHRSEDIKQEVLLTFIQTVRKGPSNLQYAFRRDCIRKLGRLARTTQQAVPFTDLERKELDHSGNTVGPERWEPVSDGGFSSSLALWEIGLEANPPFDQLTERERQMLVDRYLYGMSARELRRRYGRDAISRCRDLVNWIRSVLFPEDR